MTSKNITRRAFVTSVIALILCCSMLVGTTFAWFTDSVASGMNHIRAGNLNVELYHSDKAVQNEPVTNSVVLFDDVKLWEPGAVVYENLQVKNEGNLALQYQMALTFTNASKNDAGRTLADVLKVAVVKGGFNGNRETAKGLTYDHTLSTFALSGELKENQSSDVYGIVIYWEPDTDYNDENGNSDNAFNVKNGLTIDLGISLFATQLQHEEDSFDETYDKDATLELPEVKVETPTVDAFLTALKNGEVAVLTSDMSLDGKDFTLPSGVTAAIDLNGKTLTLGENGGLIVDGNLIIDGAGTVAVESGYIGITVNDGAALQIDNGNIDVASGAYGVDLCSNAVVNMNGGTMSVPDGSYGIAMNTAYNAVVNFNGGTVSGEGEAIFQNLGTSEVVVQEGVLNAGITAGGGAGMVLTYYGDTAPEVDAYNTAKVTLRQGTEWAGVYMDPAAARTYLIYDKTGLKNLHDALVFNTSEVMRTVNLMADIDMSGETWTALSKMWIVFDGNGHKISNLNCVANGNQSGFFGYLGAGTIKNLTLENVNVTGSQAGIFAGQCEAGNVVDCKIAGTNTVTWSGDCPDKITKNGIGVFVGVSVESNTTSGEIMSGATVTLNKGSMDSTNNVWAKNDTYAGGLYTESQTINVTNNGTITKNAVVTTSAELLQAINSAAVGSTTVVELASGTYADDINLTLAAIGTQKGDLVFKAAPGAKPVIAGTITLGYRDQGTAATMWNANVTFEGITFDHAQAEKHSIDVQDVKSLNLINCTIIGDGEYGIGSARGNATGASKITGCTFENAGMQILGNFGTGLVIEKSTFNNSCINVQAGNSVTVQNCTFNNTLTDANVGESFYLVRSNSTAITVKNCTVNVDSTVTGVGVAGSKGWGVFVNRGTIDWTVSDVNINLTAAATSQTALEITKCTSTGKINTTNLNVKGVKTVSSDAELSDAIEAGNDVILAAGEYTLPDTNGKTVTISGTSETKIDVSAGYYADTANLTFNGVTISGTDMGNPNGGDYELIYSENATFINCIIDGAHGVGRDGAKYIGCTFNLPVDYVWTFASDVTFEGCTFNSQGKALLLYNHGGSEMVNVVVKNCVFNATGGAKAGAIANQNCAAIEIDNYGCSFKLTAEGNTVDDDFSGEWRIKSFYNNGNTVTVNNVSYTTIAIDGKTMTIDANKNVTVNN